MIKIHLIAVGKLKETYWRDACAEYVKRLAPYAKVSIIEIGECRCPDNPSPAEITAVLDKEGAAILAKIPKGAAVIPLCIEGTQLSSEAFSEKLESLALTGCSDIALIIGGSFGLAEEVKRCGALRLSFGKMTLPHQLMRVVLLEQIYRAFTIANHTKYHK